MAVHLRSAGSKASMIAAINALTPTTHPGQSDALARMQSAAVAEINAFPNAKNVYIQVFSHRDNFTSRIEILIEPAQVDNNGNYAF